MLEKNTADTGRKTEKQPGERIGKRTMEKRVGRSTGIGSCWLEKQMNLKKDGKQACWQEQYLRVLELCLTLNNMPYGKDKTKGPVAFCAAFLFRYFWRGGARMQRRRWLVLTKTESRLWAGSWTD